MAKKLECRIVLRYHNDGRVVMGMYDPLNSKYEPLGTHGPSQREVDKAVAGLRTSIERAGHRLTFSEASAR